MLAEDFRWTADKDGEWLCIKGKGVRKVLESIKDGKLYDVEIKQHREKRSLSANAYCWVLMDRLAEATGVPKTDIYRQYIRDIGGNCETVYVADKAVNKLVSGWMHNGLGWVADVIPSPIPGSSEVILYYGSSTYDTAQMSRLIELIIADCKDNGIEYLSPDKLSAMMEAWNEQKN